MYLSLLTSHFFLIAYTDGTGHDSFSFLGAVSLYFVCSLPGSEATAVVVVHGVGGTLFAVSWHWLDLRSFSFTLKSSWALCELCWVLGPQFCKNLQQMLTAVPGQHTGALAPAEPSSKADGMLLPLARFSLVNTFKILLFLLPALDLGIYCVYLKLRWFCQFSQLLQERQPTVSDSFSSLFFPVGLAGRHDSLCMIWGKSSSWVRYNMKLPQKRPLTNI